MGLFDWITGGRKPPEPTPAERAAQAEERRLKDVQSRWEKVEEKYRIRASITAVASGTEKRTHEENALVFDVDGFKAYMPISRISTGYVSNINEYVGKALTFRIVGVSAASHTVTVSASEIQAEKEQKEREAARQKREEEERRFRSELEALAHRDYVVAKVVGIKDVGINVRLIETCAGRFIDGWIHISQLSDHFVNHPSEVVKIGDEIKACASLKSSGTELDLSMREFIERENNRRKTEAFSRLDEGAVVKGTVKKILSNRVFIDLGGVDGSVHISELSRTYVKNPDEIVRIGDEVQAIVLRMDETNERIELSIKQFQIQQQEEITRDIKSSNEYKNVDNTKLSFEGPLCLRLNQDRDPIEAKLNNLKESKDSLLRQFPNIAAISTDDKLETVLRSTFPDGIKSRVFIRNLTFEGANGSDNKVLAIRPELTPGCYLSTVLKPGSSLIFKGRVRGKEFVVDSVYETTDTDQLEYEVACMVTAYRDPSRVGSNFLFDVLDQAASITKYTSQRLDEWEAYLKWKKSVAQQQIAGCKYYDVAYDDNKGRLVFEMVCESKEAFQSFKRHLRSRDILAFGNNYSSDEWTFEFNEGGDRRNKRARGVQLGKFDAILEQGYLDDLPKGYSVPLTAEAEASLRASLTSPYMARVAYELNDDDADELAEQELEGEEEAAYVTQNLLSNYHSQGFLALSAAGQFALISRFDRAINGLRNDQSKSPNLPLWLFDATRARLPKKESSIEVDEWLNPGIASNENQKAAVQKMLDAPDLCLIQGPPGTGKTTVIAEAIYQMAKRGNRILIASQSNDAVDNALDRLAETPQIRAIRLGQKSRRKLHLDGYAPHKYSEDEALRSYYSSLSQSLSSSWLDGWDELDSNVAEYDTDIRNARYFREDIAELNQRRINALQELSDLRTALKKQTDLFNEAQAESDINAQEARQTSCFKELISGITSTSLYLTDRQLDTVLPIVSGCLNEAFAAGILAIPATIDPQIQSARALNGSLEIAASSAISLRALPDKLAKAASSDSSADLQMLERKRKDIQAKMLAAIDEDDEEAESLWREQLKAVKLEIDQTKNRTGAITLEEAERNLFNESMLSEISSGKIEEPVSAISTFLEKWDESTEKALAALENLSSKQSPDRMASALEGIKSTKGKIESINGKIHSIEDEIAQKQNTLEELSLKYGSASHGADSVIASIEAAKRSNNEVLASQRQMRNTWEPIIRGFKDRLDSSETVDYDNDYFKRIYVNACNVVGISCTDNMQNLDERGFNAFDVVIIDEVSKATPPELLIPLMKARKAILVGDHRQLPPMFDEHEKSYTELISDPESIPEDIRDLMTGENFTRFQRMVTSSLFKEYFENADESIKHSLLVQYRMHSDIMEIINRFYDGRLSAGMKPEEEARLKAHGLSLRGIDNGSFIVPERHAYWIDSSSLPDGTPVYESFPGKSTSACNYLEVSAIIELLKRMASEYKDQGYGKGNRKSVGVISFYQSQVNELRRRFKAAKRGFDFSSLDVDINTVDRFQGKEKNTIIVSLVRNNKSARASKHVVAFERINVAFSRAQEMLVIVGARHMYENLKVELPNMDTGEIQKLPVYKYILEDLSLKGCLRNTCQLIDEKTAEQVLADYEKNRRKNEDR